MTTKFRSACDRCHDAKVRCSGDMPCQGCIVSKSLCFYSVSNVLGRPRGTKNKTSRRRANSSATNERHAGSDGERPGTTTENSATANSNSTTTTSSRPSARRRKNKESRTEPDPLTSIIPEAEENDVPSLFNSGTHTPTDNLWFPFEDGRHTFGLPDVPAPADFRIDCFTPVEPATPILGHTPPSMPPQFDTASLDFTMTDLPTLDDSDGTISFPWEGGLFSQDPLKTTADPCPMLPSPKSDSASLKVPLANTCTCLQQHAELLSSPSIAEMNASNGSDDTMLSLDKALSLAKQGIRAWRSLIACPNCPYNNDQEVMLLALMSIRPVTRYLQRLAPRFTARPRADSKTSESTNTSVTLDTLPMMERSRLMLGSMEVDDEERMLVFRLLFQKTVQRVRQALHSLQMMQFKRKKQLLMETSNRTAGAEDYHASSSLSHIQQITHALATALQDLESSFNSVE